jgi:hypothetical protein
MCSCGLLTLLRKQGASCDDEVMRKLRDSTYLTGMLLRRAHDAKTGGARDDIVCGL